MLIFSFLIFAGRMRSVTQEQRMAFVLKARAKKERDAALVAAGETVAEVDPLTQLVVADTNAAKGKNKRKNEGRISIPIPPKSLELGGSSKDEEPGSKKMKPSGFGAASNVEGVSQQGSDPERTPSPRPTAVVDITSPASPAPSNNTAPPSWDPLLNPEIFIEKAVDLSGGGVGFDYISTE
jgi:hypothetical protein